MDDHSVSLRPLQFGLSLAVFLFIVYVACVALAIVVPDRSLHQPWLQFFPGFGWTAVGIVIGAVESFVYGLVAGIVYAPIANFFAVGRMA